MKKLYLILILIPLSLFAANYDSEAATSVTMNGKYVWNSRPDDSGELKAVFTQTETGRWTVAFHFHFRGSDHVYEGTAEGNPKDGELKGTVKNEEKSRTFYFEGTSKNGSFTGTHSEEGRGDTGTLQLASR